MIKLEIKPPRLIRAIIFIWLSFCLAISIPNTALDNSELRDNIVKIFSVFAGFNMTLMALTAVIPKSDDFKLLAIERDNAAPKLLRQHWLFIFYLITLGLIVLSQIIASYQLGGYAPLINEYIKRSYIGFACFSFLMSFTIPGSVRSAHEKAFSKQIDAAKNK